LRRLIWRSNGIRCWDSHQYPAPWGGDFYFVANHTTRGVKRPLAFRVSGRVPELWNPETGAITPLHGWEQEGDGTTLVPLPLEAHESVFVVFRKGDTSAARFDRSALTSSLIEDLPVLATLDGPWEIRFTPGWGAPERIELPRLASWTESADFGVKHYSGTATYTYTRSFELPPPPAASRDVRSRKILLDLGNVAVIASVKVNGHDLGVVWKPPYAVDVTDALRPAGRNTLEVRVTNLWTNRLIADSALPEAERKTWATWNPCKPTDPLLPSGLLGPVTLRIKPESHD